MSVINQMLKDLDERGPGVDSELPLPASEYVHRLERRTGKLWRIIGFVLLASFLTAGIWAFFPALYQQVTRLQTGFGNSIADTSRKNPVASTRTSNAQQQDTANIIPVEKDLSRTMEDNRPDKPNTALANLAQTDTPELPGQIQNDNRLEVSEKKPDSISKDTAKETPFITARAEQNPNNTGHDEEPQTRHTDVPTMNLAMKSSIVNQTVTDTGPSRHGGKQTDREVPEKASIAHNRPEIAAPIKAANKPQIQIVDLASTSEVQARKRLADARRLMLDGVETEAIQALQDALALDNGLTEARELLVMLLMQRNDTSALEPWLEDGLRSEPQNEVYVTAKSRLLVAQGNYQEAIALLVETIEAGKGNKNLSAALAAIYQQTGNFSASAKIYNELLTTTPDQASWWLGFAISLENLGQNDAAVESYYRAVNTGQLQSNLVEYARQRLSVLTTL